MFLWIIEPQDCVVSWAVKSLSSGWNVRQRLQTIVSSSLVKGLGCTRRHRVWGMLSMIDDEQQVGIHEEEERID